MLIKRTKGEREAYMDGYEAGYNRGYERGRKTSAEKIKHRIGDIAMLCNENDEEQLNILTALLVLIIDINDEIGGKR